MSNRWFALVFVWLAAMLGWFWHIADSRNLPVAPLGYAGFLALVLWLMGRLDSEDRR